MKVYAINFWPGFSLEYGFVKHLLDVSLGGFEIAENEREADVVLTSVFPSYPRLRKLLKLQWPTYPEKTIGVIWENERPNYKRYRYSISSDFDSYGGRNCRVPLWYMQLQWPDMSRDLPRSGKIAWSSFEPLTEIEPLLHSRAEPGALAREKFCCFVAKNPEPHRTLTIERLSTIEKVELFGPISGKPAQISKYEILADFKFNLCFENSAFPGYYTEKLLQSWAGGCIPLYYSDPWFNIDFNPKAAINRIHFSTIDDFVAHVKSVYSSKEALRETYAQPLLHKRPSLDEAALFLKKACLDIAKPK
jgi:alpha(1,3/1,4) fucosyltransferase